MFMTDVTCIAIYNCLDAKAIVCQDAIVYMSPNMSFVPEPHLDEEELHAQGDGRFSPVDCFQWPQSYCKEFEYAVCIPRKESYPLPDDMSWAWYTPTAQDFVISEGSSFPVGKLDEKKLAGLLKLDTIAFARLKKWRSTRADKKDIITNIYYSLKHDLMVLKQHPLIFRDLVATVAQAQQSFLDVLAFCYERTFYLHFFMHLHVLFLLFTLVT